MSAGELIKFLPTILVFGFWLYIMHQARRARARASARVVCVFAWLAVSGDIFWLYIMHQARRARVCLSVCVCVCVCPCPCLCLRVCGG